METRPADEQPFAPAGAAAPIVARDSRGRIRDSASAAAMARLPRRGAFLPRQVATDPRFAVHDRSRREWLRRRRAELHEMTGAVSHAVGAMLASAAWLYAGGEYAAERAAESGDPEGFRLAATLTATARQHDLAAWELATREAAARPKSTAPPWWALPVPAQADDDEPEAPDPDDDDRGPHGAAESPRGASAHATPPPKEI